MANFNFNKVILGGRLVATPELKQTPSGVMVTQFTVAVNRRTAKDGTVQADFIRCTVWRELAEFVTKYFRKGSSICVVGRVQTRTWQTEQGEKRYETDVVADEVNFVDSKSEGGTALQSGAPEGTSPPPNYYTPEGGSVPQFETLAGDDDLPF